MLLSSDACAVWVLTVHCKGCSQSGSSRWQWQRGRGWDELCSQLPGVQRWDGGWHFMAGLPLVTRREHPVRKSFELGCNHRPLGFFWVSASYKSYRATVQVARYSCAESLSKCLNWWFSQGLQDPPCKCSTEILAFIFVYSLTFLDLMTFRVPFNLNYSIIQQLPPKSLWTFCWIYHK